MNSTARRIIFKYITAIALTMDLSRLFEKMRAYHYTEFLALGISLFAGAAIFMYFNNLVLPGADQGQWLMLSRYYSGQHIPDYRSSFAVPFGYPIILAFLRLFMEDAMALNLSAGMLMFLFGYTTFLLGKELFHNPFIGLVTLVFALIGQSVFLFVFSFGGYPQIQALCWMNLCIYFTVKIYSDHADNRSWLGLGISLGLVFATHFPSSVIIIVVLTGLLSLLLLKNRDKLKIIVTKGTTYLGIPFFIWLVYIALMFDVLISYGTNPSAKYSKDFTLVFGFWLRYMHYFVLVSINITIPLLLKEYRDSMIEKHSTALQVICIWFLTIGLFWIILAAADVGTHYSRFMPFLIQPLLFMTAFLVFNTITFFIHKINTRLKEQTKMELLSKLSHPFMVLMLSILVISPAFGTTIDRFQSSVNYHILDNPAEYQELIDWVNENTEEQDCIWAPIREGKWLEGLTGRPSLMDMEYKYLYRPWEFNRSRGATILASSTYFIDNGYLRIREQNNTRGMPINPGVSIFVEGHYEDIIWFRDSGFVFHEGNQSIDLARNFTRSSSMIKGPMSSSILTNYLHNTSNMIMKKVCTLGSDDNMARISYYIDNCSQENLTISLFDPWDEHIFKDVTFTGGSISFSQCAYLNEKTFMSFYPQPRSIETRTDGGRLVVEMVFDCQSSFNITFNVFTSGEERFQNHLDSYSFWDMIDMYNCKYFIIPRGKGYWYLIEQLEGLGLDIVFENNAYLLYEVNTQ